MPRIALWSFDEAPRSELARDSATGDGDAQDGMFQNGATTNGAGAAVFDGRDAYVEIPSDTAFDLETGSVKITFTQVEASRGDNPWGNNAAQTLFSRDSKTFDNGGHLTIVVKSDGSIGVRHQDTDRSYNFEGGSTTLGKPATIIYSWGPKGSELIVDGQVVDSGSQPLTLAGDAQPITIGASQAQAPDGEASNLKGFFSGEIAEVAIYDEKVGPGPVPCFVDGTLIRTPSGDVPVGSLKVGDLVCTLGHGAQPVRWIGSRCVVLSARSSACDRLRPVRIMAGALAPGFPRRDLLVSRQHRMLVSSTIAARYFDGSDVLSAAINLTALPGVFIDRSLKTVTYIHLMFDRHEVVFAEGAPCESLYLGEQAVKALSTAALSEILGIFPRLGAEDGRPEPAFPIPAGGMQKKLATHHVQGGVPLLESFRPRDTAP